MDTASDLLTGLIQRLDSQIKSGQRKKALKTVEEGKPRQTGVLRPLAFKSASSVDPADTRLAAVLKLAPKDADALKSKAVLLVDLDRFDDANALIEKEALDKDLWFEKVRLGGIGVLCCPRV